MAGDLVFAPLGGVGEIGMNLSIYGLGDRHRRTWMAVDQRGIPIGGASGAGSGGSLQAGPMAARARRRRRAESNRCITVLQTVALTTWLRRRPGSLMRSDGIVKVPRRGAYPGAGGRASWPVALVESVGEGYFKDEVPMSSAQPVRISDLPDAARTDVLQGASVPVESGGVRVATIVPERSQGSRLLALGGALRFPGRLDIDDIDAALEQRRG